jgi:hypothetical protein
LESKPPSVSEKECKSSLLQELLLSTHTFWNSIKSTVEKNRRHGPCKMTKQQVFGSNHLQDLSPEEFKSKFLTGYKGPRTDELEKPGIRKLSRHSAPVLNPKVHKVNMHESVKQRVLQQQQPIMGSSGPSCKWYDISCFLRWVWQSAGVQFGSIIGTMEPKFDASAFPNGK